MWRSVFLHEFPDTNIRNFQALAGSPTPASLRLMPAPSPPLRTNAVGITPGEGFEYILAQTLDQVIGISGRIRIRGLNLATEEALLPIMWLGDRVEFRILQKPLEPHPGIGVFVPFARAFLRIGQTEVELGTINTLPMPPFWFTEIRFDWHTSGQARLLQDGQLVGYQNAVAPSIHFDVASVVFGMPNVPLTLHAAYAIERVFVRVLRRPDPLSEFSKLLPAIPFADEEHHELCQLLPINNLLAMTDRMRQFMSLIQGDLSQPWTASSGPAEGPFRPEAITAHQLATQAVVALAKMMRNGDFSTDAPFLEPFEAFLRILHDARPAEFASLVNELIDVRVVPEECSPVAQKMLEENKEVLGPIVDVLSKATDRLRDIAGGF